MSFFFWGQNTHKDAWFTHTTHINIPLSPSIIHTFTVVSKEKESCFLSDSAPLLGEYVKSEKGTGVKGGASGIEEEIALKISF